LEQRKEEMESQLQQLFMDWDQLQDRGEATRQARVERDRILKQIRELLSHRTYINNILNDLAATIA
jgi:molecular chaperone HscB